MPVPASPAPRGAAIPARPVPSPRPGQILSGPRQPLPAGMGDAARNSRGSSSQGHQDHARRTEAFGAEPSQHSSAAASANDSPRRADTGVAVSTVASACKTESRGSAAGEACGSSSSRYGGEIEYSSAFTGSATASAAGHADSSGESGSWTSYLYRPGASGSAFDAWSRRTSRSGGYSQGGYNRGPGGPGGPGGYNRGPAGPGGPAQRGRPMHPTSPLRAEPATLPTDPGRRHATSLERARQPTGAAIRTKDGCAVDFAP